MKRIMPTPIDRNSANLHIQLPYRGWDDLQKVGNPSYRSNFAYPHREPGRL